MAKNVVRQDVVQVSFDVPQNPFKGITDDLNGMKKLASDAVKGTENSVKGLQGVAKGVQKSFAGIKNAAKIDNVLDGIDSDLEVFNVRLKIAKERFDSFTGTLRKITLHPIKSANEALLTMQWRVASATHNFKNLAKQKLTSITSGIKQITNRLTEGQGGIKGFATALKNIGKVGLERTINGVHNLGTSLKNIAKTGTGKLVSGLKDVATKLTEIGKNAASMAFNGLKKVAGVSFKALSAGLMAVATGVGALVAKSVQSFADYEQLVDGVDTLFKDSSGVVQQNAANAFTTAGLSANQYMETVTSFSASLLQSLGGDTAKAAAVADKAIVDMSDNANKMGTSMESIQNAYQGFAKQNYTMLDNLKLGYGGTKEEMQRLLADAGKLAGQKFDISSYADVIEAIHVIQTEMGITGTTAAEASTTIQGSLASMKGAWQNVLTALVTGGDGFDSSIENLVSTVKTFAGNVIPAIQSALGGVGKLITELAPIIAQEIPTLVNTLLPPLISAAVQILQEIANALPNLISTLLPIAINAILQLLNGIISVLDTNGVQIINAILNGLMQAINGIISILPQFIQVGIKLIVALIVGIVQKLPELIPVLIQGFFTAIGALIGMIPEIFSGLWNAIASIDWLSLGVTIINSIWEGIKSVGSSLWEGVKGLFSGNGGQDLSSKGASAGNSYATGLQTSINNISLASTGSKLTSGLNIDLTSTGTTTAQTYVTSMDTGLATSVTNATTTATGITQELGSIDLTSEGADTVQGLINGMNSKKQAAIEAARAIANAINAEYRKIQDINSPSRVWEKFGSYQIQGDIKGMKKELPNLKSAVKKAGETATPAYTPESSTVNNNRTAYNTYSPVFNLNMNGASATEANARKVKRMVQEAIKETFNSMSRVNPQLIEV